jgi:NAD(P)H-hydrate repair Nnr-like enzyme with NAD(P)H-hydrate epimerase domain
VYIVGGDGVLAHGVTDALVLARHLRRAGLSVDYALSADKYVAQASRNQLDGARKSGARAAIAFDSEDQVVVQGLFGKISEAPKHYFAAAPLLEGDAHAYAALKDWIDRSLPSRPTD